MSERLGWRPHLPFRKLPEERFDARGDARTLISGGGSISTTGAICDASLAARDDRVRDLVRQSTVDGQLLWRHAGAMDDGFYHEAQRRLQDSFGSRALADRLESRTRHDRFTEQDAAFIAAQSFFFLATADRQGRPDCSFKGGAPGFARVVAPDRLVFPDYDGNGMFRSLGNIEANPNVGLLFVAMYPQPWRMRVNGVAKIFDDHPDLAATPGAQLMVEVTPSDVFPNCGRYIPSVDGMSSGSDAPQAGVAAREPAWKSHPLFSDVLPPRRRP